MKFSITDKTTILLNIMNFQQNEINRREEREQKWFEWATSLLLASFGATIALSGRSTPLPSSVFIKLLASVMILLPTILISLRLFWQRKVNAANARAVERIEDLLYVFDDGRYGNHSPLPPEWAGKFATDTLTRQTPLYYVCIVAILATSEIAAIWLVL